jgi:hypothetical protein
VNLTAVGLVETGLKHCPEPHINNGVSGLRLPLLHQNCPLEPLDLGCLCLGQVLQLSTLSNSDDSVHPVHCSRDLTVLCTVLCSGTRATWPGLRLSQTRILTLSVPSSSPRTLTKRPTGRRTDSLTLLLLGLGSRLVNLEPTPTTSGLIVGSPGGHGSTLGLLFMWVFFGGGGSTTGSLPFLLSRPMTRWIERRDEPADGTMNGAAAAARTMAAWLWTAATAQLWTAVVQRRREQRRGGGETADGAVDKSGVGGQWRCESVRRRTVEDEHGRKKEEKSNRRGFI